MRPAARSSIATILIVQLVTVVTLVLSSLGAITFFAQRAGLRAQFQRDAQIKADSLVPALVLPIWNLDGPQMEKILDSAMLDRSVAEIRIQPNEQNIRAIARSRDRSWRPVPYAGTGRPGDLVLTRELPFAGRSLGRLTLSESTRFLDQAVRADLLSLLTLIVLVDAILVCFLFILLRRTVLRPLAAIHSLARDMSQESLAPDTFGGAPFPGEFQSLRAALRRTLGLLQNRFEERRAMEMQLQHAQRLESLGRLTGGIAHDMNNVLAAIMTVASTLDETGAGDPASRRGFQTILKASARGRDLVRGLSQFVRKQLESTEILDLNDLVRREFELLAHTTLKKVEITLDLAEDLAPIQGDPSHLGNALMNLCVNAMDAMPQGGRLAFRTRNLADGQVECAVSDDGEGMPPEVAERAVEPFFTTKAAGKGTGLGLSSVFGTMQSHGGAMIIESAPGQGTTIRLRFPAHLGEASTAAPAAPAAPGRRGLRILLVDDEDLLLGATIHMLESLGHRAEPVTSGQEALRGLNAGPAPDLVILDQNMPGLTGLETLMRIRAQGLALPVLMISGYLTGQELEILGQDPRSWVLPKPFTREELGQKLAEILS